MRSRQSWRLVLALIWAVGAGASAEAQPAGQGRGEKYALLVGVRHYDPNELRALPFSEADVVDLAKVLKASGYRAGNVVLMTQAVGAEDTRFLPLTANVRAELKLLLQDLNPADSVLVAFAGHGVQFRGDEESYFCPANARLADKSTLIALGDVYRELDGCAAGLKVLLVDACRNDPQSENARARSSVSLESVTRPQRQFPPGGVVAFFSCSEGERAFEHADLGHGVFFHFVIEALRGAAATPDEREILVPDLEKFVKRRVRDYVREKYGVRQMPELKGTTRDLVPLVSLNRTAIPTVPQPAPPLTIKPAAPEKTLKNSIAMTMTLIPAGEFTIGSPDSDPFAKPDEKPQRRVRISRPFYLSAFEVTQGQYATLMGVNPSWCSANGNGKSLVVGQDTSRYPVESVSWLDAVGFCNRLSERERLAPYYAINGGNVRPRGGEGYRLPTSAEWEYACRGGTTGRYSFGDDANQLALHAWFASNSGRDWWASSTYWENSGRNVSAYVSETLRHGCQPHPVGQKRPNGFGLHDMHGNVWEWCWDYYDKDDYARMSSTDPSGPATGAKRMLRGGGWNGVPQYSRAANHYGAEPDLRDWINGFRPARTAPRVN